MESKSKRTIIWLFFIVWYTWENTYFGWNARSHSDAELIADGIGFLLAALAVLA